MAADLLEEIVAELRAANELLRSAYAVAARDGFETNWPAFRTHLKSALVKQSVLLHNTDRLDAATCTAKTFRLPLAEGPGGDDQLQPQTGGR